MFKERKVPRIFASARSTMEQICFSCDFERRRHTNKFYGSKCACVQQYFASVRMMYVFWPLANETTEFLLNANWTTWKTVNELERANKWYDKIHGGVWVMCVCATHEIANAERVCLANFSYWRKFTSDGFKAAANLRRTYRRNAIRINDVIITFVKHSVVGQL